MIDEHAKDLLKHFARCLILGISREQDRLPTEMAPHALDEGRWRKFLEHVAGQSRESAPDTEAARNAEQVRVLLIQHGLTPEGATHWATEFRRALEDWRRAE